jgi:tetratricopeptide (TPR) repeat protein
VNYLLLGNCYVRLGQLHAAISCYNIGAALQPDLPWVYVNRGLAHLDLKDYAGAIADFDRVVALRPDMAGAYINRAVARMGVGDFARAVHPDNVKALGPRGVYHARLGRRDAALADARAALALGDQAVSAHEQAFTTYQVAGIYALTSRQQPEDRQEALRLLATALRKDASWLRVLPGDHDFDAVRGRPEYGELLHALAAIEKAAAPDRKPALTEVE